MRLFSAVLVMFSIMLTSFQANALEANRAQIDKKFGFLGLTVSDVQPSDMTGLFEVSTDQGLFFANADGSYFIQGKLYSIADDGKFSDVLTQRYAKDVEKFAKEMIVYPAKNEKYVVNVFTDITCGYCAKLHSEMKDYNDLGITVRYLAYPRQGPVSPVAEEMAKIWCAADKNSAMDFAKAGKNSSFDYDKDNFRMCQKAVYDQYQYGRQVGINGTPAILTSSGQLVAGYVPAKQLLSMLEEG